MSFLDKILGKNVGYFRGCMSRVVYPDISENYIKILRYLGIPFILIPDEICCGSPLYNQGLFESFKEIANKNLHILRKYNIGKLIFSCPACCNTFRNIYPKFVENYDIETEHVTETIVREISRNNPKLEAIRGFFNGRTCTYHDPCHLGRELGIYDAPRKILDFLGFKILEPEFTRELATCCGGGGGLRSNFKDVSLAIARKRVEELEATGAEFIVTACPMCYANLRKASNNKVYELSQVIDMALNGMGGDLHGIKE